MLLNQLGLIIIGVCVFFFLDFCLFVFAVCLFFSVFSLSVLLNVFCFCLVGFDLCSGCSFDV